MNKLSSSSVAKKVSKKVSAVAAVKPTAKGAAKATALKSKTVAVAKAAPTKKATTAGAEVNVAQLCRDFVTATFADKSIENPRAVCVKHFMKTFNMKSTTASTYFGNAMRALLKAEAVEAAERVEANKPVWSAYKLNSKSAVTSVGLFTSATAANAFNDLYRHDGTAKGVIEVGTVIESKKAKPAKTAKAA
jgi:hypothetical protein